MELIRWEKLGGGCTRVIWMFMCERKMLMMKERMDEEKQTRQNHHKTRRSIFFSFNSYKKFMTTPRLLHRTFIY